MRRLAPFKIMYRDRTQALCVERVRAFTARQAVDTFLGENPNPGERMQHYAVRDSKPSAEMLHVLNLARRQGAVIGWVPLVNGKGSQSRTVGRQLTIEACRRHGWLNYEDQLTIQGREIVAAEDA